MREHTCPRTSFLWSVLAGVGLACTGSVTSAQVPSIGDLSPLGLPAGQTTDLTVMGGNLSGATELWMDVAGKSALATGVENNGQDAAKCIFRVVVPAEAPLGVHGVRIATAKGVSKLRPFLIDDLPTTVETGGNGSRESAQVITLPCAVDGRVDNLSRDFFRFQAKAGQEVSIEIWGRRLGSPLDPVFFLYREDGRELNFSDDAEGLSSDPQLVHVFEETGDYFLEVRDIQYRGGAQHFYRLRLGDFPCVNLPLPAAVQAGVPTRVDFAGISIADATPDTVNVPADYPLDFAPVKTRRSSGKHHAFGVVAITRTGEFLEREPNDTREQANIVPLGHSLNGRFDKPRDVDRFVVTAAKGDALAVSGKTRLLGAPTDLTIRVLKPDGSQLASVDDTGTDEGSVNVSFPDAGDYVIEITDLHKRGGGQYAYRVQVERTGTAILLEASADVVNIPTGGVQAITVSASRGNHQGIDLTLSEVPPGITVHPVSIGPGQTSAVLSMEAAPDAPAGVLSAVQIVGATKLGEQQVQVVASLRDALRPDWNNSLLIPLTVQRAIGVGIVPAEKLRLSLEPAELTVKREQKVQFTIKAARGEGMDEAITLATNPEKNALPKGLSLEIKGIDKGANEIVLELAAAKDAPLGRFALGLNASHKKGNDTTTAVIPSLRFVVTE